MRFLVVLVGEISIVKGIRNGKIGAFPLQLK